MAPTLDFKTNHSFLLTGVFSKKHSKEEKKAIKKKKAKKNKETATRMQRYRAARRALDPQQREEAEWKCNLERQQNSELCKLQLETSLAHMQSSPLVPIARDTISSLNEDWQLETLENHRHFFEEQNELELDGDDLILKLKHCMDDVFGTLCMVENDSMIQSGQELCTNFDWSINDGE